MQNHLTPSLRGNPIKTWQSPQANRGDSNWLDGLRLPPLTTQSSSHFRFLESLQEPSQAGDDGHWVIQGIGTRKSVDGGTIRHGGPHTIHLPCKVLPKKAHGLDCGDEEGGSTFRPHSKSAAEAFNKLNLASDHASNDDKGERSTSNENPEGKTVVASRQLRTRPAPKQASSD